MIFKGISPSLNFRLDLKESKSIKSNLEISGRLSGEILWVNFGHEKSYFEKDGTKKDK